LVIKILVSFVLFVSSVNLFWLLGITAVVQKELEGKWQSGKTPKQQIYLHRDVECFYPLYNSLIRRLCCSAKVILSKRAMQEVLQY
jgi:hypothetical protein